MKKILALAMMVLVGLVAAPNVMADDVFNPICEEGGLTENQRVEAGCDVDSQEGMKRIIGLINVAVGLSGIIAVVVVVFGGQRYLTSAGEPGRIKQAKDMIMYGVIGLVVAMLAWAIVNFVVSGVTSETTGSNLAEPKWIAKTLDSDGTKVI